MQPIVNAINALESKMQKLSDASCKPRRGVKEKLDNGATLDDLLIEAFAALREASRRVLKMRHYDVQLMGRHGAAQRLDSPKCAPVKQDARRDLARLPERARRQRRAPDHGHDYLAKRDAEWMGRVYKWMGLSIGTIVNQQEDWEKRAAYKSDICYGQNNEYGFDYLRDNMKDSALEYAQRRSTTRSSTKSTRF